MTSVNERQYQIPFCQVLASEEETILYVSPHGPFEKGKDVITRKKNGEIRAYQLKAGDIGLTEWREIYGEIVNLVELPVELPGAAATTRFVPYLVTNGEVTDPVLEQIRASNAGWQDRGLNKKLQLIQKGELFERFRASHGSYLPRELEDFRTFLELILRLGTAPADKEKAAQLIEHVLPHNPDKEKPLNISRAASSIVLLTAYISRAASLASNHWSQFEYWVLAGAYVLYLREKSNNSESQCLVSLELCETAAEDALRALADECSKSAHFVQGPPLIDGHTYRARIAILAGLLSALALSCRVKHKTSLCIDMAQSFLHTRLKEARMWGESAVPYLYLAALEVEQGCRASKAEGIAIQLVREISAANNGSSKGRGIPTPYYSPEEALKLHYGLDPLNDDQFIGMAYSIAPLVDFLARRWRRQALASLWSGVTRLPLVTYRPRGAPEWFRWKSTEGALSSSLVDEPQSWDKLRTRAETLPLGHLPASLVERPAFAIWFILVYPHRFTPDIAKLIEDVIWQST